MKKKVAVILAGLMVLSCMGCNAPAGESAPNTEPVQATESVEASVAEPELNEESQAESTTESESAEESEGSAESETAQEEAVSEGCLQEVFARHGMKVGTCLTPQMITNTKHNKLILEQFSSVTMENAMKPDYLFNKKQSIETDDLVVEFNKDMLKMLEWAKENNMPMRGHTLVWYSQTPDWIFYEGFDKKNALVGREVMLARMESYIKQVFEKLEESGYADLFYAYDVANEAWEDDGSLRVNNWSKTIGEDYLWYAFYYAKKYAPANIALYYNDYNEQFKTDALVAFVKTLVDEDGNSLIDGIGLQAHLYTKDDLDQYFKCVDTLATTGLKLELTELDVSLGAWQNTLEASEENLKIQGKFYYDLIHGLFERADAGEIQMDALTFWGFSDGLSWRGNASPLLYDKTGTPKYAYYGALQEKELAGIEE